MTDQRRVNAAVRIRLSLLRRERRRKEPKASPRELELRQDLDRLIKGMNYEEYNQYLRRIE